MPIIQTPFQTENSRRMTIRGMELHQNNSKTNRIPVILSHGFSSDLSRMMPYGMYLAEHGYSAFLFDFCGGGYHTASDGSFHDDMTPLTEVDDLKSVIRFVQGRNDTDRDKICLMGNSMGGFVSALAAAEMKKTIKALILFYPAFCIPDDARSGHVQDLVFDPHHIPEHIGHGEKMVCGAFARSVMDMDIYKEIAPYTGPVLIGTW
jgi:alpha-beta hydrolase superfamily lysophospholipase